MQAVVKRRSYSALALLPAFLLMAGRTTSVLAEQTVRSSGTYNSPSNAALLKGTGSDGNSPGYDPWSTTGRSGGTGGTGPSITQNINGSYSSYAGTNSIGGKGGTGGTSIGSGGSGGSGGSLNKLGIKSTSPSVPASKHSRFASNTSSFIKNFV